MTFLSVRHVKNIVRVYCNWKDFNGPPTLILRNTMENFLNQTRNILPLGMKPDNSKKSVAIFFLHDPCCHKIRWKISSSYLNCCLGISLQTYLKSFWGCKLFFN